MPRRARSSEHPTIAYRKRPRPRPRSAARRAPAVPAPAPDVHVPAPPREGEGGGSFRWLLTGVLLLFLVASVALAAGLYLALGNRVLPGVHTLGVDLGGQSVHEAAATLQSEWQRREIALVAEGNVVATTDPESLGLLLDADATARTAYRQGRSLRSLPDAARSALSENGFQPIWYFDPNTAAAGLEQIAPQVETPAVDAGVRFVGGEIETTPPAAGRALDAPATVEWLQANAASVAANGRLPLVMRTIEPAITDVSAVVAAANELMAEPIHIRAYDPVRDEVQEGDVPPAVWTEWLALETGEPEAGQSSPSLRWRLDETQVESYLQNQAETFGPERYLDLEAAVAAVEEAIDSRRYTVRLRIYHHDRQHVVQPGDTLSSLAVEYGMPYPWIQEANPGVGDNLRPGQTITIPSPDVLLPLPVVENKRVVISLSQQRMWAYENERLLWEWPVSTGIDSSPTAPGVFQVQSHEPNAYASIWDLWMPHFIGIYRPAPGNDFMNGFHGFPTRNGSNLLWTNSLGRPVTYGCILVSNENVRLLYDWAEEGVVVEVRS